MSDDQREMERAERLELIKDGNVLHPTNLERHSILLREEMDKGEAQQLMQEDQAEKQRMAQMAAEEQQAAQQEEEAQMGGQMAGIPEEGMVEQGQA